MGIEQAQMQKSIQQTLTQAKQQIPAFEAEILLAFVLQKPRSYLRAFGEQAISPTQQQQFLELVERRLKGEPIAYLTGTKEFWSLPLHVNSAVLIPRPETELLVELILQQFAANKIIRLADLGTGSGAIALALAHERPQWSIIAVDKSLPALDLARQNATALKISNVEFLHSNWGEKLAPQSVNIIVSNPPYLAPDDPHLQQGDLRFEPQEALMAAQNGLHDFRLIAAQARKILTPGGALFFEHGYEQGPAVRAILQECGFIDIATHTDLAGHERVTRGIKH